jgi:hypothetical protein
MKAFILVFSIFFSTVSYGQEWVTMTPAAPVVVVPAQPSVTYTTIYQPTVVYQWVPQVVQHPVVVYKKCMFMTKTEIQYIPSVQWVYVPVLTR